MISYLLEAISVVSFREHQQDFWKDSTPKWVCLSVFPHDGAKGRDSLSFKYVGLVNKSCMYFHFVILSKQKCPLLLVLFSAYNSC